MEILTRFYNSGYWTCLLASVFFAVAVLTNVSPVLTGLAYLSLAAAAIYCWRFSPDARNLRTVRDRIRSRS